MYYRRKVLLALVQTFGGSLGKTKLQKLLLLFTKAQEEPAYHFVPYTYGCFSFQAMADMFTMQKYGQLTVSNIGVIKTDSADYISTLKEKDQKLLRQLYLLHNKKEYRDLIHYTYTKYPYFAIHSKIAERYLNNDELQKVGEKRPVNNGDALFTIGYEGVSLEEYLNKLIAKDVRVLIDVRNNASSMKYGFTKSQLSNACSKVDIEYIHLPELGIVSEERRTLNEQSDYDRLFEKYRCENLPRTVGTQQEILRLVTEKHRVALTCFEANICQCHRKHLAEAITRLPGWNYPLIHL